MASANSAGDCLPMGWTQHVLNGQAFYYHAATNATQQDHPAASTHEASDTSPDSQVNPDIASVHHALSPCHAEQQRSNSQEAVQPALPCAFQDGREIPIASEPEPLSPPPAPSAQLQPQLHQALQMHPGLQPMPPLVEHIAPYPPSACQAQSQAALPQALQMQPGVYTTSHPQPPAVQHPQAMHQAQAPTLQPGHPTARPSRPTMAELQVMVPEPGLRAGQQLAFAAPAAAGHPPQQMAVTVNRDVVPGSTITVQYPIPHVAPAQRRNPAPVQARPRMPRPTSQVHAECDQQQSRISWLLYGFGCSCLCLSPLLSGLCALILWFVAAALYFCKPARQRARLSRSRAPAYTACMSIVCCIVLGLIVCVGLGLSLGSLYAFSTGQISEMPGHQGLNFHAHRPCLAHVHHFSRWFKPAWQAIGHHGPVSRPWKKAAIQNSVDGVNHAVPHQKSTTQMFLAKTSADSGQLMVL